MYLVGGALLANIVSLHGTQITGHGDLVGYDNFSRHKKNYDKHRVTLSYTAMSICWCAKASQKLD